MSDRTQVMAGAIAHHNQENGDRLLKAVVARSLASCGKREIAVESQRERSLLLRYAIEL
jgi:hypothetical protein